MKIYVVGVEHLDYISRKTDQPVKGTKVHYLDLGRSNSRLTGYQVSNLWIPDGDEFSDFDWKIGSAYLVYKDGYYVEQVASYDLTDFKFAFDL